jgi:hypothetical protein
MCDKEVTGLIYRLKLCEEEDPKEDREEVTLEDAGQVLMTNKYIKREIGDRGL